MKHSCHGKRDSDLQCNGVHQPARTRLTLNVAPFGKHIESGQVKSCAIECYASYQIIAPGSVDGAVLDRGKKIMSVTIFELLPS